MDKNIINLALKGGGVKGIAYVGALQKLNELGHYDTIKRVSGTSAGALVALMVALNLSPEKIKELMGDLDFSTFKQGWNPIRIFTKYGLYTGDAILEFIYRCYDASPLKPKKELTFKELDKADGRDLIVFASNLNENTINEFSVHQTPNCIVAEAVRASMSIPIFFKSWKFSNGIPNDHIYVDGGVTFNYPLSFFDHPEFNEDPWTPNEETLGLFLEQQSVYEHFQNNPLHPDKPTRHKSSVFKKYINKFKYNAWITTYFKHLISSILNSQNISLFEESFLVRRTVFIDDLGISATKFNLTEKEKDDLLIAGYVGVEQYIKYLKSLNEKYTKYQQPKHDEPSKSVNPDHSHQA
ncbi:MAG: patatin-like phospholipase family protein [Eudoraea sp.]|nr:patatin-like phospholipase family protein [Eudoraea sp.]